MATEFTPELDAQVLEALKRKIKEQEAQQISDAQGMASARGLAGSTFEATRIGLANKASLGAQTDAMVNMALQRANMQREERLISERNQYDSLEAEKQRAYASGENEKARMFEQQQAEINRQFQQAQSEREGRDAMKAAGLEGGLGLVGNLLTRGGGLGGLFGGGGAAGAGGAGAAGAGAGAAGPLGLGALGGIASTGIGLFGGGYAGQKLAGLTGKVTRESKAGSAVGAGIGTLFGGPIGGIVGGAAGGLVTKGVQGIAKKAKKIFCFDPSTMIEKENGEVVPISSLMLHDRLKDGGEVESIRVSVTPEGSMYFYEGVNVTGSHAVKEDGKWVRVEDSQAATPVPGSGIVFSLVTSTHRLFINGIEFADEHETDDYEELSIDESLARLNEAA